MRSRSVSARSALIAQDRINPRTATLLLRNLAQASANLSRIERQQRHLSKHHPAAAPATSPVDHPTLGPIAPEAETPTEPEPSAIHTSAQQNQDFIENRQNAESPTPTTIDPKPPTLPAHHAALPATALTYLWNKSTSYTATSPTTPSPNKRRSKPHYKKLEEEPAEDREQDRERGRQILADRALATQLPLAS